MVRSKGTSPSPSPYYECHRDLTLSQGGCGCGVWNWNRLFLFMHYASVAVVFRSRRRQYLDWRCLLRSSSLPHTKMDRPPATSWSIPPTRFTIHPEVPSPLEFRLVQTRTRRLPGEFWLVSSALHPWQGHIFEVRYSSINTVIVRAASLLIKGFLGTGGLRRKRLFSLRNHDNPV